MRWHVSYTRNILIAAALVTAATMAFHLIRHQPPTLTAFAVNPEEPSDLTLTAITLTFKEFHPAGNQFTGSVVIESAPYFERLKQQSAVKAWAAGFHLVLLRFNRRDAQGLNFQGGSDTPITMAFPPAWGSQMGYGTFNLAGEPPPSAFYYPFDKYVLSINPELLEISNPGSYTPEPIQSIEAEFANSNFIPRLHPLA